MDIGILQSIWTVVAMTIFIAISLWAWSGARKAEFDEASRLPFDSSEDEIKSTKTQPSPEDPHV